MTETNTPHRDPWWTWVVVVAMLIAMPLGIFLAIYLDDPSWLAMSGIAFILIYAG